MFHHNIIAVFCSNVNKLVHLFYHQEHHQRNDEMTTRSRFTTDVTALGDFDSHVLPPVPPAYINKPPPYSTLDHHGAPRGQPLLNACLSRDVIIQHSNANLEGVCRINLRNDPREPINQLDIIETLSRHVPVGVAPPDYDVIAPVHANRDVFFSSQTRQFRYHGDIVTPRDVQSAATRSTNRRMRNTHSTSRDSHTTVM
jgi:hypothetical protein